MLRSEVGHEGLAQLCSALFIECLNAATAHCFLLVKLANMLKKFPVPVSHVLTLQGAIMSPQLLGGFLGIPTVALILL